MRISRGTARRNIGRRTSRVNRQAVVSGAAGVATALVFLAVLVAARATPPSNGSAQARPSISAPSQTASRSAVPSAESSPRISLGSPRPVVTLGTPVPTTRAVATTVPSPITATTAPKAPSPTTVATTAVSTPAPTATATPSTTVAAAVQMTACKRHPASGGTEVFFTITGSPTTPYRVSVAVGAAVSKIEILGARSSSVALTQVTYAGPKNCSVTLGW